MNSCPWRITAKNIVRYVTIEFGAGTFTNHYGLPCVYWSAFVTQWYRTSFIPHHRLYRNQFMVFENGQILSYLGLRAKHHSPPFYFGQDFICPFFRLQELRIPIPEKPFRDNKSSTALPLQLFLFLCFYRLRLCCKADRSTINPPIYRTSLILLLYHSQDENHKVRLLWTL